MKYILILLLSFPALADCQVRIREVDIVKDSTGKVCNYETWNQLLFSGSYTLVAEQPKKKKSAFILTKLTEEETEQRLSGLPMPQPSDCFITGETLEWFYATDLNGRQYKLEDLRGKVVVLHFWYTDCRTCVMEIPALNNMVDEFSGRDIVFIGIALDHKKDLEKFLKNQPFKYNIIPDGEYLSRKYLVPDYPTHVIIDKTGRVKFHTTGLSFGAVYWIKKTILALL